MKYDTKIVADSIGPNGVRLTTMEFNIWKPLLAEFNTHGLISSRNFPSSRAIPWKKMREKITEEPHVPFFRVNNPGMQPGLPLIEDDQLRAREWWLDARDYNLKIVEAIGDKDGLNIHKQWLNRLIEPWIVVRGLVTATDWDNFFNLRLELSEDGLPFAQDEFYFMAQSMQQTLMASTPKELAPNEWHLPYVDDNAAEWVYDNLAKPHELDYNYHLALLSAGKCATVSYDNIGSGIDHNKDYLRSIDSLLPNGHMSVFQHQAMCVGPYFAHLNLESKTTCFIPGKSIMHHDHIGSIPTNEINWGQLRGWQQFRKILHGEECWQSPRTKTQIAFTIPEELQ